MQKYFLHLLLIISCASIWADPSPTIVITCATGELGQAIAHSLAPTSNLILTGRDLAKLNQLQRDLKSQFAGNYTLCPLDYTSTASLSNFKKQIEESTLAGLVLITPRPNFGKNLLQEEAEWMQLFQMTFTGPLEVLKATLPKLKGKIVIIAGTTSMQLMPEYGPTCIIRRMWTTYAKALAHQLGPQGIHVNALSPGVVLTPFHEERVAKKANDTGIAYDEQMIKEVTHIPLQRYAHSKEIAQTVKFLLSPESDYITGVNLLIDGGTTVSY